jgi:hypothetical protein
VLFVALGGEVPGPEEIELPEDIDALLRVHREAIDSSTSMCAPRPMTSRASPGTTRPSAP